MIRGIRIAFASVCMLALAAGVSLAVDLSSLTQGKTELKSAGALAFGPEGLLLVADPMGGAVFAFDTRDTKPGSGKLDVSGINDKVAAFLGTAADQILINDMAVHPVSRKAYLSVSRGRGPEAVPVLLRVDGQGKIEEFSLTDVRYGKAMLPNPPASQEVRGQNQRLEAITDLAFVDNRVFVAGLSNEDFASNLRSIPFPFQQVDRGTSVEIFHGAHGRFETNSPVRTFVPYEINGDAYLLAAYTCTPLVKFPVSELKPGAKVVGTTIAELGNRNRPLDMIAYKKEGKPFILMNNSSRGVMKLPADGLAQYKAITAPTEIAGVPYETVKDFQGVEQLDRLDDQNAVILVRTGGSLDLRTVPLP